MTEKGRRFAAVAVLAATALVLFRRVLLGETLFYGDFHAAFEPLRTALQAAWRSGLPLWNATLGNGQPILANPLHAALYPPNLVFALSSASAARLLSWLALLHVGAGAAGAYLLFRRMRASAAAAVAGAAVFAFSGATLSGTYMVVLSTTQLLMPWLLLACAAALDEPAGRSLRATLGVSVAALLLALSGDPFLLASALLGAALVAWAGPSASPAPAAGPPSAGGARLRVVLGLVAAALAYAPLAYASARYVAVSVRSEPFPLAVATARSLHPIELLELLFPRLLGDGTRAGAAGSLANALHGGEASLFLGLYAGLVPCLLALLGALEATRRRTALLLWLAVLLLLALGLHTPLYALVLKLPGFGATRYPMKWLLGASLPFSALVAIGADRLRSRAALPIGLGLLGLAAAVAAAPSVGAARALAPYFVGEEAARSTAARAAFSRALAERFPESALLAAAPLAALLAALLWARRSGRVGGALGSAAALVLVDLSLENARLLPTAPIDAFRGPPPIVQAIQRDAAPGRLWIDPRTLDDARVRLPISAAGDAPARFVLQRAALDLYAATSYGLRLAFNSELEALAPKRYAALGRAAERLPDRERAMLLGSAEVTHVLTSRAIGDARFVPLGVPDRRLPLLLYRNSLAVPRVRLATRVERARDLESFLSALHALPDDFFATGTLLEGLDGTGTSAASTASGSADTRAAPAVTPAPPDRPAAPRARLVEERGASLRVETDGPAGALVVSDALVPGWRATVDGRPARLLFADHVFRGVVLPAGRHVVELRYDPFR